LESLDASHVKDSSSNSPWIVVFLKTYDPWTQSLKGVCHVYVRRNDKVGELIPTIQEKMGWSNRTDVSLFEEIKPTMIEPIKTKSSFHSAEIQDGDIICFQKTPTEMEVEELRERRIPKDAKEFYDFLVNLTAVRFIPKNQDHNEFTLPLSKKNTYDEIADKAGAQLEVPATHLRFWTVNSSTGLPRSHVKRNQTLQQMLGLMTQYYLTNQVSHNQLYFEVLDMSLAELETKRLLKFIWLPEGVSKEEQVEALVPKNGTLADVLPALQKRFNIPDDVAERLRFFTAHFGKYHKDMTQSHDVAGIQEYHTLYAEIVPDEELDANLEESRIISTFHFHKEPGKAHSHGVPFKFVVKKGEVFSDTRTRLQTRTGIKGKPFEKIKFAVVKNVNYSKPIYLNDDDVLYEIADDENDFLGLDHVDRNGRNGWGRVGAPEIRIK